MQCDRVRGLVTLEEERRGWGGAVTDRQTCKLRHLWEEALLPAWGTAGEEAGRVRGEESEVAACPLPAELLLLSAFSSLSDSF